MQRRSLSAIEAVTNVLVGYAIAAALTWLVLPLFGLNPSPGDALGISAIFTAASLVRSYLLRRAFARLDR